MIQAHATKTGSTVAEKMLADWENALEQFTKVYPRDYKRIVEQKKMKSAVGAA